MTDKSGACALNMEKDDPETEDEEADCSVGEVSRLEHKSTEDRSVDYSIDGSSSFTVSTLSGLPSSTVSQSENKKRDRRRGRGNNETGDQPRRRFSNLSNLAQSLPSTTLSTTSGFPVTAGSLDFDSPNIQHGGSRHGLSHSSYTALTSGGHPRQALNPRLHPDNRKRHRRRESHRSGANSGDGREKVVRRTRSALETSSLAGAAAAGDAETRSSDDIVSREMELVPGEVNSDDSEEEGTNSPLLVPVMKEAALKNQAERVSVRHADAKEDEYQAEDQDMETYAAQLEEATNALLTADECKKDLVT